MSDRRNPDHARISEAEWAVMDILWDRAPLGSSDVAAALAEGTGWSPKTVQTLLGRLVKKGCLAYEDQGGRYLYRPAVPREQAVREESHSFLERVFGGDASSLMAHFARRAELTAADVAELRRLLDERVAGGGEPETGGGKGR
jgi:BlaI family transcriptional regulator, penicillinase repressor